MMPVLLAEPIGATFGFRDYAALIFIGVAITVIWLGFRHMQGLMERTAAQEEAVKPPVEPPPSA